MHGIFEQTQKDGGQNSAMNPASYYNTGRKFEMSVTGERIVFFTKYTGKFKMVNL